MTREQQHPAAKPARKPLDAPQKKAARKPAAAPLGKPAPAPLARPAAAPAKPPAPVKKPMAAPVAKLASAPKPATAPLSSKPRQTPPAPAPLAVPAKPAAPARKSVTMGTAAEPATVKVPAPKTQNIAPSSPKTAPPLQPADPLSRQNTPTPQDKPAASSLPVGASAPQAAHKSTLLPNAPANATSAAPVGQPSVAQQVAPQPVASAQPEPQLERHYLPAGAPRARASMSKKQQAPSIGGLIHSMEAKPSKTPYYTAAIGSVAWLVIGGLLGGVVIGQGLQDASGHASFPDGSSLYILAATVLVPIALFWFIAQLVIRSREMKLMASTMTEVAIRLAEPDKMAEQKVASVGQTIRRQVSAMDDAISRAIGRAGELEALVHNEVAALERSYSQNEYIIRNLLNELVSEREAIAQNGQQVQQTLQGVGKDVSRQIRLATEDIGKDLSKHGTMSAMKLQRPVNMSPRRSRPPPNRPWPSSRKSPPNCRSFSAK